MTQKAPGKAYRTGITLAQLFRKFPDDEAAEQWFAEQRWGDDLYCPHCGSFDAERRGTHPTMPYRCLEKECSKHFSVRSASVMQRSKLGYQTWVIAIYLLTTSLKGVSSMKLHRDLGITQKSAWHLSHRLRQAWATAAASFEGPVEVDEAYFGGREHNKHEYKKLRAGRGTVGKTAVMGVKDRASNIVRARVARTTTKNELAGFVQRNIVPDAMVYSDEAKAYDDLLNHESVRHGVGEYVRGRAHINGMESFWATMKRGFNGTYHKMSPKHLDRYVDEFAGRHNLREEDTEIQMRMIAQGLLAKRLQYRELIAPSDLASGARPSAPF